MQVLVLAGGLSAERDVSLRSGRRVAEALRVERPEWEVLEHDVDAGLLDRLRRIAPTASCRCCTEPPERTERCEMYWIVEDPVRRFGAASRSPSTSRWPSSWRRRGNHYTGLRGHAADDVRQLGAAAVLDAVAALGLPIVVKPTKGGSSLGTSIVHRTRICLVRWSGRSPTATSC